MPFKGDFKKEDFTLKVDWKYLSRGGVREYREKIEMIIGFALGTTISLIIGWSFFLKIVESIKEGTPLDFTFSRLFWLLVLFWLFALYLLRDRDKFWDTLKHHNLDGVREKGHGEVDIAYYIDHDLISIIDNQIKESGSYEKVNKWSLLRRLSYKRDVKDILSRLELDDEEIKEILKCDQNPIVSLEKVLSDSFLFALNTNQLYIDEVTTFVVLVRDPDIQEMFFSKGVLKDDWDALMVWVRNNIEAKRFHEIWEYKKAFKPNFKYNRGFTNVSIPELERYSRDITRAVKIKRDFTISLGREKEMEELIELLGKMGTNSLLIGEPGVGKTTLLESLAIRMVMEDVPDYLKDKRLVEFNFNKAYLRSKNFKEFAKLFQKILESLEKAQNIVLVIDNFEQLLNSRKELASEISNFLISIAENKNLHLIATTTNEGYSRYIKTNPQLDRLFSKVFMEIPAKPIAMQIVLDEARLIEKEEGVKINFDAITQVVKLSDKYQSERVMPDKALDILREAVVEVKKTHHREIDAQIVSDIMSRRLGVRVGVLDIDEKAKLKNLEVEMRRRIVGQDKAIEAVCSALRRERFGLRDETKPIASFLFAGPTGVGKTEVARTFTRLWFGGTENMIRLDMSEYQEAKNLDRLIGFMDESGEYNEGYLTSAVRQKPFSLILLDEIEKANPRVLDLFLQIFDEGRLKDGLNRDTDFKNCVIIATSNVGSKKIAEQSTETSYDKLEELVMYELKQVFRIEFLNRFDDVIVFRSLTKDDIRKIALILLQLKKDDLRKKGYNIEITNELVNRVADEGYSPIWGARELKRVIEREVEKIIIEGK